jgi:hypothetical protein
MCNLSFPNLLNDRRGPAWRAFSARQAAANLSQAFLHFGPRALVV